MMGSHWLQRPKGTPSPTWCPTEECYCWGKCQGLQFANDEGTFERTADCPCQLLGSFDTWGHLGNWGI